MFPEGSGRCFESEGNIASEIEELLAVASQFQRERGPSHPRLPKSGNMR
jgi:hypothetical protein